MTTAQHVRRWLSRRKTFQQVTRRRKFLMGIAFFGCAAAGIATAMPGVWAAPPELLNPAAAARLDETLPDHTGVEDTGSAAVAWATPGHLSTPRHDSAQDSLPPIISASEYDEEFGAEFGGEIFGLQDGIALDEPASPLRGLAEVQTNRIRAAEFQKPADLEPASVADLGLAPIGEAPALQAPTVAPIQPPTRVTSSAAETWIDAIPSVEHSDPAGEQIEPSVEQIELPVEQNDSPVEGIGPPVEDIEHFSSGSRPAGSIRRSVGDTDGSVGASVASVGDIQVNSYDISPLNRTEPEPSPFPKATPSQFSRGDGEFVIMEQPVPVTVPGERILIDDMGPIPMDGQMMVPPGEEWGSPVMGADCGFRCPGLVYVQADALAYRRTGTRRTTLSQAFRLDRFNFRPAARITLGRRYDCLDGWEATYIGPFEWRDRGSITGTNLDSFLLPEGGVDISAFNDATFHSQSYRAQLNSFEINRKWWGWDVFAASLGFRYIRYDEELRFASTTEDGDFGGYRIKTENDLLGGQLGLDLAQPMGRWTFVGKCKGGLYANFADSRTTLINSGIVQFDNEADKTRLAGSIELGYHATYALTPTVSLRSGYDAWWLIGLALAPEQDIFRVNPLSGTRLDTRGNFFVHGWSAGVEMVW